MSRTDYGTFGLWVRAHSRTYGKRAGDATLKRIFDGPNIRRIERAASIYGSVLVEVTTRRNVPTLHLRAAHDDTLRAAIQEANRIAREANHSLAFEDGTNGAIRTVNAAFGTNIQLNTRTPLRADSARRTR